MSRIGILGAGQLGRMLALAAHPLNIHVRCLDPAPHPPAAAVATCITAPYEDDAAVRRFLTDLDVVTYEFENVPRTLVEAMARHVAVYPPPVALSESQDRFREKALFARIGAETADWEAVDEVAAIVETAARVGFPCVLKTCRMGYDGKGQAVLRTREDAERVARTWETVASLIERFVPFEREVSLISVRGLAGDVRFYPLVENRHENGILRLTRAPATEAAALQASAEAVAARLLETLGYVGVLAIEFFVHQGRLLANEMAPRVHNSGHWTIEGAVTSQFENHVRAICGLPLGDTSPRGFSAMINLIGDVPAATDVLAVAGAHLHLYGKSPRPGRKLGHVTVCADNAETVDASTARIRALHP